MLLDEWQELTRVKKVNIVVLDMPLLDTTTYKSMDGLENLISEIILQLLSYIAEDERKRIINKTSNYGLCIFSPSSY